jgi:integrase
MKVLTPKLERIKQGWAVRLRCGAGQHQRFRICVEKESAAAERARRMAELARSLVSAGKAAEAVVIVRKAGEQTTEAGLREVEAVARELCERSPRSRRAVVSPLTFQQLAERWTSGELARRHPDHVKLKRSVEHDRQRFERLCVTVGNVPLPQFGLEHAKAAMAALPQGLSPATRRQYAQLIAKLLKLAVYPCEVIERYPLPPGFLPRTGQRPALSYLSPLEDARLLRCTDIPLATRLLYGFLAREGLRLSEALELKWRHLDTEHATIRLERTKTGEARAWALGDGVVRALAAFRGDATADALVFAGALATGPTKAAGVFRSHLKLAGVERAELYERTPHRRPIRIHDLRATFITLALADGRSETWVQDRTGHTTSIMLNRYRRQARHAAELGLGELMPLDQALPDLSRVCKRVCNSEGGSSGGLAETSTIPPVAPAGVEPARLLRRGILNPDRSRTSEHERVISDGCDTPGDVAERGCTPEDRGGVQRSPEPDAVERALALAL